MQEIVAIAELRRVLDAARGSGRTVGFVPTMGYLHAGHVSLMEQAASACDVVVASVFVNPLQFAPGEDLAAYPRDLDRDRVLAAAAGVTVLFVPSVEEMYPKPMATTVSVAGVSDGFEGASRPAHFPGVATVVAKLFNIVGPCRAHFGEKDYQQVAVVRRMCRDLSVPVEVVMGATVREDDGLAMSSRNAYLRPHERVAAPVLYRALRAGADAIEAGERDGGAIRDAMVHVVSTEPLAELDYLDVADADTLAPLDTLAGHQGAEVRLLGAVKVGAPRLIDNLAAHVPERDHIR